jgi:hypothetical protein
MVDRSSISLAASAAGRTGPLAGVLAALGANPPAELSH